MRSRARLDSRIPLWDAATLRRRSGAGNLATPDRQIRFATLLYQNGAARPAAHACDSARKRPRLRRRLAQGLPREISSPIQPMICLQSAARSLTCAVELAVSLWLTPLFIMAPARPSGNCEGRSWIPAATKKFVRLGLSLLLLLISCDLAAAQIRPRQIGVLSPFVNRDNLFFETLRSELARLGYGEGKNFAYVYRNSESFDGLSSHAADMARRRVD